MQTLSAGDSGIGTLTLSAGNLAVASGVVFDYQIGAVSSDLIQLTGTGATLDLSGSYTLNLSTIGGALDPEGRTFVLLESTVAPTIAGTWIINYGSTGWIDGVVSISGNQVILSGLTSAIPEPSTATALFGVVALVTSGLRRRRR